MSLAIIWSNRADRWSSRPAGLPHSTSYSGTAPSNTRRLSNAAAPQLYDFSKTDRPGQGTPGSSAMGARAVSTPGGVAASLPVRGYLQERVLAQQQLQTSAGGEDMELDMQFGGSDDDDRAGSGRSGSQDIEMEVDEDTGEIITQALGTGSGGVKGRRKGETFDCEFCGKVSATLTNKSGIYDANPPCRHIAIRVVSANIDGNIAHTGRMVARRI